MEHFATLVQQPACTTDDWIHYADALAAMGDEEQAQVARERAVELLRAIPGDAMKARIDSLLGVRSPTGGPMAPFESEKGR